MARTSKRASASKAADPADRATRFSIEIGKLLRARRNELGLTQTGLAEHVGVSQQQIVKYEKGVGRIPADSLMALCRMLRIDAGSIFYPLHAASEAAPGFAEGGGTPFEVEAFADRDTVTLVRAFQRIGDKAVRRKVLDLVATLAGDDPSKASEAKKRRR